MARPATTSTEAAAGRRTNLRRDVGVIGLLFASVGSIIGSGWLFGALDAAQAAGPAAIVSWALGGFMILLIALVYASYTADRVAELVEESREEAEIEERERGPSPA